MTHLDLMPSVSTDEDEGHGQVGASINNNYSSSSISYGSPSRRPPSGALKLRPRNWKHTPQNKDTLPTMTGGSVISNSSDGSTPPRQKKWRIQDISP